MRPQLTADARSEIRQLHTDYGARLRDYLGAALNELDTDLALADTLLSAAVHAGRLSDARLFRAWLYALARAHRSQMLAEHPATTGSWRLAAAPDLLADALAALQADHREALDLAVRHGLTHTEIAAIFDLDALAAEAVVAEAAATIERWIAAVQAADTDDGCTVLDELLGDGQPLTRLARTQIGQHVAACPTCDSVPRTDSVLTLLDQLPLQEEAGTLHLDRALARAEPLPDQDARWRPDGFPVQAGSLPEVAIQAPPAPLLWEDRGAQRPAPSQVSGPPPRPAAQPNPAPAKSAPPGSAFLNKYGIDDDDYPDPDEDDEALARDLSDRERVSDMFAKVGTKIKSLGTVAAALALAVLAFRGMQTPTVVRPAAAPATSTAGGMHSAPPADGSTEPGGEAAGPVATVGPQEPPTIEMIYEAPTAQASPAPTIPVPQVSAPAATPKTSSPAPRKTTLAKPAAGNGIQEPPGGPEAAKPTTPQDKPDTKSASKPAAAPPAAAKKALPAPPAPTASIDGPLSLGTSRSGSLTLSCPGATCQITSASSSNSTLSVSGSSFTINAPAIQKMCTSQRDSASIEVQWSGQRTGDGVSTAGTTPGSGALSVTVSWTIEADKGKQYNLNGTTFWSECNPYTATNGG